MELSFDVKGEDIPYEEDVLNNRHSAKSWLRYLAFKKDSAPAVRAMLYERSLKTIPGSYKLWHRYLLERKAQLEDKRVDDPAFEALNNTFERALTSLHKMPVIWLLYLQHLAHQRLYTRTRHAFDRALQSLPITQHDRVWPHYLSFVKSTGIPETTMRVYRRFLKLEPTHVEDYIEYLITVGQIEEAARQLARVIDDDSFSSLKGKSKHDLWLQLTELAAKHPKQVQYLRVEPMIRTGLAKFTNEVGRLWTSLADYYIRLGHFERARDVFEEGISTVVTVRDFSQLWDAYSEFEYGLIQATMEDHSNREGTNDAPSADEVLDLEMSMARYERLIERQPVLISDVFLRQNPHNVTEWLKRVTLFENDKKRAVEEFTRAFRTIDPAKATGKLHLLWIAFATFWEQQGRLEEARKVLEKAVGVNFKKLDHLASVWCEYVEVELRHGEPERARALLRRATAVPPNPQLLPKDAPSTQRVFKSVRLWSLYADLEESYGTFLSCKAVYEELLALRIASPAVLLAYAQYLEENRYFEESFRVYERGVSMFKFPVLLDVWVTYLRKFMQRYGGTKLERLRDLFEQAVEAAPAQFAPPLYVMFAEAEEQYGLARHAMLILDRGVRKVDPEMRPALFNVYLQRATENFGVTRARQIFEKALEMLDPKYVKGFALRYAHLERRLGEIDRARAILTHCAQFCPPMRDAQFWDEWREFEVKHGSVDTVREMFRVKRSVAARYATTYANFTPATTGVIPGNVDTSNGPSDKMQVLEQMQQEEERDRKDVQERQESTKLAEAAVPEAAPAAVAGNDDEIALSDEEDEGDGEGDEAEEDGFVLAQKNIPSAVFGSANSLESMKNSLEKNLIRGAKERLKGNK